MCWVQCCVPVRKVSDRQAIGNHITVWRLHDHSWSTMVSCVSCMQQHPGISLFLCTLQICYLSFYQLSHAMTTSACFPSRLAYSLLDHSCNRNCVRAVLNAPLLRGFFSCWSTFCAPGCIFNAKRSSSTPAITLHVLDKYPRVCIHHLIYATI